MTDGIETLLRSWGLTDTPEEFEDGIHSWRCQHPSRYGRCSCFQEAVSELEELIRKEREDAWTEGFDRGFYRGQVLPGDRDASEAGIENPYRKE